MRNHFLRAGGVPSSGDGTFGGVTTNLTTHWDFGNSSSYSGSGSTVTDLSGNGNHGTLQNTSNISYSSNDGGHIVFDPSASSNYPYIERPDTIKDIGTGDFTLELWFNPSWSGSNTSLFRNLPNTSSPFAENFSFYIREGQIRVSSWLTATDSTTNGEWYYPDSSSEDNDGTSVYSTGYQSDYEHLVFSRIGTGNNNMKMYRNNSLIDTWTNKAQYDDANTNSADEYRSLGRGTNDGLRGKLGIYRLYVGKGFTSSNVTTNWNLEKSRFGH